MKAKKAKMKANEGPKGLGFLEKALLVPCMITGCGELEIQRKHPQGKHRCIVLKQEVLVSLPLMEEVLHHDF